MTRYGRSPWLEGVPKARVPAFPKHKANELADVVVIGGGLTGCAAAHGLVSAGLNVILLEADRIGRGATAFSTGWLADDPGVAFQDTERALGLKRARWIFQAWRRSALDLASQLRRLKVRCALEPSLTLMVARTPEQAARLAREHKERKVAGLEAALLNARAARVDTRIDASAGLRTRESATIDPYRATLSLAAAAAGGGAQIFEKSPVRRVSFTRKIADVFTAGGRIRTKKIVVATGAPTDLYRSLKRHFWYQHAFVAVTDPMPAKIRKVIAQERTVVRDMSDPPHLVRWMRDHELMVAGANAPEVAPRLLPKMLVQRTGQLMYELSTLYPDISGIQPARGWAVPYARTAEGLPYIGSHRNFPFHIFAWGDSSPGITGSWVASRVIVRWCLEKPEAADAAFDFNR